MKIFYTTDLHGRVWKYEAIVEILRNIKVDLVIIGADILPKGQTILKNKRFITGYLSRFFQRIKTPIIIDFGNDDFYMFYDLFKECVNKYDHVYISHMNEVIINNYSIIGMHYVPDYPFGIKDWCRSEKDFLIDPIQLGIPIKTMNGHIEEIDNLEKYFLYLPTIEDCLSIMPRPSCDKVVYNIHAPPRNLGLDVCNGGRSRVGSYAITKFIIDRKPLLTLHGHIHESSYYSGITFNKLIPETMSIQPGQTRDFTYCTFDLNDIGNTYSKTIVLQGNKK